MDTRRTIHPHPSKKCSGMTQGTDLACTLPQSHKLSIRSNDSSEKHNPQRSQWRLTDLMGQRCSGSLGAPTYCQALSVLLWEIHLYTCSSVFCTIPNHTFGINKVFYFENKYHCHACLCSSALHILTQLLSKMESGEPLLGCFRSTLWSSWWRIPRGLLPQLIIVCL